MKHKRVLNINHLSEVKEEGMKRRIGYKKVFWLGFVLLLALCFALSGAAYAKTEKKADKKEILIGTNLPLTGILSMVGIEQRWAYETAVADINKAGGVMVKEYGKKLPVKLIVADDESDPGKAAAAVERLIKVSKVE